MTAAEQESLTQALQRGARGVDSGDPLAMQVITDANANRQREADRALVKEAEILQVFGCRSLDEFAALFPYAARVGCPRIGRTIVIEMGKKDRASVVMERFALERWLTEFGEFAERMGYVKKR